MLYIPVMTWCLYKEHASEHISLIVEQSSFYQIKENDAEPVGRYDTGQFFYVEWNDWLNSGKLFFSVFKHRINTEKTCKYKEEICPDTSLSVHSESGCMTGYDHEYGIAFYPIYLRQTITFFGLFQNVFPYKNILDNQHYFSIKIEYLIVSLIELAYP